MFAKCLCTLILRQSANLSWIQTMELRNFVKHLRSCKRAKPDASPSFPPFRMGLSYRGNIFALNFRRIFLVVSALWKWYRLFMVLPNGCHREQNLWQNVSAGNAFKMIQRKHLSLAWETYSPALLFISNRPISLK